MVTIVRESEQARIPSRLDHIEALFQKYRDVTKETIFKAEIQREGVLVTEAAADLGRGLVVKTYQLFSWDMSPTDKQVNKQSVRIPDMVYGFGGPYNLRRTAFRPRANYDSPYMLDALGNVAWILDRATHTPLLQLDPWHTGNPEWYYKTILDGYAFHEYTAHTVFRQCQYWGPEEECKYCDINENGRVKKQQGQVQSIQPRDPLDLAEVEWNRTYMHEDSFSYPKLSKTIGGYFGNHIVNFNGGTILEGGHLRQQSDDVFYQRYVEALRARNGGRVRVIVQGSPHPVEVERRMHTAGVTSRVSNFEVWDPQMFKVICPGKDRFIGRDEWIRRLINQVEVYGVGNVNPGFVAGVEMAQPWGFKTVAEAVASTTAGIDFLSRHGVVTRPIQFCVEALGALAGQPEPPVDYFIQLDRNYWEIYYKYSLPPQNFTPIGPGRNVSHQNGGWDM
ncbi:MAG: hypothetical protein AAB289_01005, partial [Chloroflexota bacterium]